jgi:hypothetical protein
VARHEASLSSSALSSASYDDETLELEIRFTSGQTYTFYNVPPEIYEGLVSAPSPGRYFHSQIKGIYG